MWQRFTNCKKIKQDAAVSQPIVVKTCLDIILHRLFYGHIDTESGDMVTNMVFGILPIIFITSPINYLIIKIAAKEFMKDIATSFADSYFHQYIRFLRPLMIESKQQQHKPDSVISVITRDDDAVIPCEMFILVPENGLIFDKIIDVDKENITFKGNSRLVYRKKGDEKPIHFSSYKIKNKAFLDHESPEMYIQYVSCLKVLQDMKKTFEYTQEDIAFMINTFYSTLLKYISLNLHLHDPKIHIIFFSGEKEDVINTIIEHSFYAYPRRNPDDAIF